MNHETTRTEQLPGKHCGVITMPDIATSPHLRRSSVDAIASGMRLVVPEITVVRQVANLGSEKFGNFSSHLTHLAVADEMPANPHECSHRLADRWQTHATKAAPQPA
jgi:hypothetical protein